MVANLLRVDQVNCVYAGLTNVDVTHILTSATLYKKN